MKELIWSVVYVFWMGCLLGLTFFLTLLDNHDGQEHLIFGM